MADFTIDHLGIAVPDLEQAIAFYRDVLGMPYGHTEVVEEQKVRVAFFPAGASSVELLEPTSDDSAIAKFLAKQGRGGIHHVAFRVADLRATLARLQAAGVELIDREPRPGGQGKEIAFIHPKATGGVLVELCALPAGAGPTHQ